MAASPFDNVQKDKIYLTDWSRILNGDAPPIFLAEAVFRGIVMFLLVIVAARLLGKRMNGQLTITELAVMLSLGAIIALPLQTPTSGLLVGAFLLTCAVIFQRGINWLSWKSEWVERWVQGRGTILVRDGVIDLAGMREVRLSHDQLFATLRSQQIYNLGQVKRVYLEACGVFSVYRTFGDKPGLPILPSGDTRMSEFMQPDPRGAFACEICGTTAPARPGSGRCPHCGAETMTPAAR